MQKVFTDINQELGIKFEGYTGFDKLVLNRTNFRRVFCVVNYESKIVIVKENGGGWNFPGGKMEAGEKAIDTLIRELIEEADVIVSENNVKPLALMNCYSLKKGVWSQEQDQLICYSLIKELPASTPDPDQDIVARKLVPVKELDKYIRWGNSIPWIQDWLSKNI